MTWYTRTVHVIRCDIGECYETVESSRSKEHAEELSQHKGWSKARTLTSPFAKTTHYCAEHA